MWHKSDGDGVLEGASARLLKMAATAYVEHLRESGCWSDDVDPRLGNDQEFMDEVRRDWFDVVQVARMEYGQRLHMIATVVRALLDPGITAPALTADSEATVYQIYRFLCHATDIEYDMLNDILDDDPGEDGPSKRLLMSTRNAIAAAAMECSCECDDADGPPEMWHALVDELADTVLWDRDWEMEGSLADSNPVTANAVKALAGIDEGYFTTPVEEPTVRQVCQAKAYLESIADEIRTEEEAGAGV